MDKIFAEMFSKEPKEIIENDFYYGTDSEGDQFDDADEDSWLKGRFKSNWENAGITNVWRNDINNLYSEVTGKIADDGKPFMEIACGPGMGLAPAILKKNPKIPCLATDACSRLIKAWRYYINRNLMEYNISLASFSNLDIPIKDNSLYYVTSAIGIASTRGDSKQAINEIYRTLKPGGYLVAIENEWTDLSKIDEVFKLLGQYNYYGTEKRMSWHDQFTLAGFKVESEDKHYYRKLTKDDNDLGEAADRFNIEIGMKFTLYVLSKTI